MCWHISVFSCAQSTFVTIIMRNLYTAVGRHHYCTMWVAERDFASWALIREVFLILCWALAWMGLSHQRKLIIETRMGILCFIFKYSFCVKYVEIPSHVLWKPTCFSCPWVRQYCKLVVAVRDIMKLSFSREASLCTITKRWHGYSSLYPICQGLKVVNWNVVLVGNPAVSFTRAG
jgi:hypothetical protein